MQRQGMAPATPLSRQPPLHLCRCVLCGKEDSYVILQSVVWCYVTMFDKCVKKKTFSKKKSVPFWSGFRKFSRPLLIISILLCSSWIYLEPISQKTLLPTAKRAWVKNSVFNYCSFQPEAPEGDNRPSNHPKKLLHYPQTQKGFVKLKKTLLSVVFLSSIIH